MATKDNNTHLWSQFIRLGERIADGDHYEDPWISKEYKRLSRILVPEMANLEAKKRKERIHSINQSVKNWFENHYRPCECGGNLLQTRSGSKTLKCIVCHRKYQLGKKKRGT